MITIKLFCAAGMSTSVLVDKMKKAAAEKGMEVFIDAYPTDSINMEIEGADVILLGPQVKYLLTKVKKIGEEKGVPVDVIPIVDYGMLNGENVLNFALKKIKKGE